MEAEEFTEQLYQELKSTPQPCLVPFLKVVSQNLRTLQRSLGGRRLKHPQITQQHLPVRVRMEI